MASTTPADNYIISRDANEAERLEVQHRCILSCQGYHIHPSISNSLPSGPRVAELATGNTIWLREVAAANPSAECHGFDISNAMFPTSDALPSNVKLHTADIKQPLPEQWTGYFDVVHIRMVMAAMRIEDWAVVVQHAVALLKPGGWLQWYEDDRAVAVRHSFRPVAPAGSAAQSLVDSKAYTPTHTEHLSRFNRTLMPDDRALAMNYGYMNLDTLFANPEVGNLEDVSVDCFVIDRHDDGGELRKAWAVMGLSAVRSFFKARQEASGKGEGFDYEEWSEKAMREIEGGAHWISRATCFIGRKKAS